MQSRASLVPVIRAQGAPGTRHPPRFTAPVAEGNADMRHVAGIVLAAVAAVVIFFAGGWGYLKLLRAPAPAGAVAACRLAAARCCTATTCWPRWGPC